MRVFLIALLATLASVPLASASVPMGVCAKQTDPYCPGTVCVWYEAKYICETPVLSQIVCVQQDHNNCPGTACVYVNGQWTCTNNTTVSACTPYTTRCAYPYVVCVSVDGKRPCIPDPCLLDPELCNLQA